MGLRSKTTLGTPRGHGAREDRLDQVVEVAARLFRERGYRATRLDDIADELGVTRAALYYYFPGKAELFEEVCRRGMVQTEAAIAHARSVDDAEGRLRSFCSHYEEVVTSDYARAFFRDSSELRPVFRQAQSLRARKVTEEVEDMLRYGIENGQFRPDFGVTLVASALLALLNSLAVWHRPSRHGSLGEATEGLVNMLLDGIVLRHASS